MEAAPVDREAAIDAIRGARAILKKRKATVEALEKEISDQQDVLDRRDRQPAPEPVPGKHRTDSDLLLRLLLDRQRL